MNFYRNVEFLGLSPSYLICFTLKMQLNHIGSDDVPGTLSIQYKNTRNLMKGNSDRLFIDYSILRVRKISGFFLLLQHPNKNPILWKIRNLLTLKPLKTWA